MRQDAIAEARGLVEQSKAELSQLLGAVRDEGVDGRAAGRARTRLGEMSNDMERRLAEASREAREVERLQPARAEDIADGTPVVVATMGWKGTALGPPSANGKVSVLVGSLRVDVPVSSLELRPAD
jgi:hypothetical protein